MQLTHVLWCSGRCIWANGHDTCDEHHWKSNVNSGNMITPTFDTSPCERAPSQQLSLEQQHQ
eukprot:12974-Heterococcus_DN1.PRE.4